MKVAVIGGGSTYTPELVQGLIERASSFPVGELWLMDIDLQRLEVVGGFARRMAQAAGAPFSVHLTDNLDEALAACAYVFTQIRVGGMRARREDEYLGRRWGLVGQETTGVGGFAKALRTIPVLLDMTERMQRHCPQAWLVNFTNPSGLVTQALSLHAPQIRSVGLCNGPINAQRMIADQFGGETGQVRLEYLGLNHLSWIQGAYLNENDLWGQVFPAYVQEQEQEESPACPPYLLRLLQAIPSSYLRYYYRTDSVLKAQAHAERSRAEEVMLVEETLIERYRDPALTTPPPELAKRGGALYSTAAAQLVDAIHNDTGNVQIVNAPHAGAAPDWPADWVAELSCRIDSAGVHPLPAAPLPPLADSLARTVKSFELLAVQAAVTGDRQAALEALLVHPLGPDGDQAETFLDDLIQTHRLYLPQFS